MGIAEEMLGLSPSRVDLGIVETARAIEACEAASMACTSCADSSLAEEDVAAMRTCIARAQNCADVCTTTQRALARPLALDHGLVQRALRACIRACESCAGECHRHAPHHAHCAACERTCRACIEACAVLLD
jgi:hypothetical protein